MQLSQEQIASILDEAKPSIIAGLTAEATRQAHWEMSPIVSKLIQDEVTAFMATEIVPVIKAQLVESKEGLVSLAIITANQITEELARGMTDEVKKRLESSYSRGKIFEALFK
jgi:hypothetical protein